MYTQLTAPSPLHTLPSQLHYTFIPSLFVQWAGIAQSV